MDSTTAVTTATIATTAVIAVASATIAIIIQSDTKLGRSSYIINAEQLLSRRIQQYIYFWQQSLYRIEEYINYNYSNTSTSTGSIGSTGNTSSSGITEEPDYRIEQNTDYILSTSMECTNFVTEFLLSKDTSNNHTVYIGRIGSDRSIARKSSITSPLSYDTIFVWFYVITNNKSTIYQISLEMITNTIATIMECQYIFTGTFCFITDASCSVVSDFICNVVDTAFNNTSTTSTSNDTTCIEFLQQPYWMLCYAVLVQQIQQQQQSSKSVEDNTMLQKLVYTLIRIEAIRLTKKDTKKRISTIIVTIPSSINTILLPLLVQAFPSDRHIFAYTNGISTVSLSLQATTLQQHNQQQQNTATSVINSISQSISSMLPTTNTSTRNGTSTTTTATTNEETSLEDILSLHTFRPNSSSKSLKKLHKQDIQTIRTIPMNVNYLYKQSHYITLKKIIISLTNVSTNIASILDIWLSSIDIFFTLKNLYCEEVKLQQKLIKQQAHVLSSSSSKKSKALKTKQQDVISTTGFNYVPYVFKLDFLVNTTAGTASKNSSNINTNDEWEYGTDKYWSLRSLLQYVTGKQNREISNECIINSIQYIQKYQKNLQQQQQSKEIINNTTTKKHIENIIFQHKLVLIADKTLQDTVLPAQHWVLLNTNGNKSGCACCGPEDDDDTDDEIDDDYNTDDDNTKEIEALVNNSNKKEHLLMTGKSLDDEQELLQSQSAPVVVEQEQQQQQKQLYIDGRMGFAFDPNRFS